MVARVLALEPRKQVAQFHQIAYRDVRHPSCFESSTHEHDHHCWAHPNALLSKSFMIVAPALQVLLQPSNETTTAPPACVPDLPEGMLPEASGVHV